MAVYLGSTKVGTTILTSQSAQNAINAQTINKDYITDITGLSQSADIAIDKTLIDETYSWQGDNVTIICEPSVTGGKTFYLILDTVSNNSATLKLTQTKPQTIPYASWSATYQYGIFRLNDNPLVYRPSGCWNTTDYE